MNLITLVLNPIWLVVSSYFSRDTVYNCQRSDELGRFIYKIRNIC